MQPPLENTSAKILKPTIECTEQGHVIITDLDKSPQAIEDFFKSLSILVEEKQINTIHFKGNELGLDTILEIEKFLRDASTLRTLVLEGVVFDSSLQMILSGLATAQHIKGLHLISNCITDESLQRLAVMLEKNLFLIDLTLIGQSRPVLRYVDETNSCEMFQPALQKIDYLVINRPHLWGGIVSHLNDWNKKYGSKILDLQREANLFDINIGLFLEKKSLPESSLICAKNLLQISEDFFQELFKSYENPKSLRQDYENRERIFEALREKIRRNITLIFETVLICCLKLVECHPAMTANKWHALIDDFTKLIRQIQIQIPAYIDFANNFFDQEAKKEHEIMRSSKQNYSTSKRRLLFFLSMITKESPHFGPAQHVLASHSYYNSLAPCISMLNAYPYLMQGCRAKEELCEFLLFKHLTNLLSRIKDPDACNLILGNITFTADVGINLISEVKLLLTPFTPGYFSVSFYKSSQTIDQYLQSQDNNLGITAKVIVDWLTEKTSQQDLATHLLPTLFKLHFVTKKMVNDFGAENPSLLESLNAVNTALSLYCSHTTFDQRPVYAQTILAEIYNYSSKKLNVPGQENELTTMIKPDLTKIDPYEKESALLLIDVANNVLKFLSSNLKDISFYGSMKSQLENILIDKNLPLPRMEMFNRYLDRLEKIEEGKLHPSC